MSEIISLPTPPTPPDMGIEAQFMTADGCQRLGFVPRLPPKGLPPMTFKVPITSQATTGKDLASSIIAPDGSRTRVERTRVYSLITIRKHKETKVVDAAAYQEVLPPAGDAEELFEIQIARMMTVAPIRGGLWTATVWVAALQKIVSDPDAEPGPTKELIEVEDTDIGKAIRAADAAVKIREREIAERESHESQGGK